ncbi:MAG: tetratricopeptide repeat protein, partial [Flammeovirgaceae bacterium]|nr:tetratricopeptide repeat protein [Flammeovirgaceae bacterium]MDW8287656.1 tetratricopeptide repeat protein [Flammeovirgaceae bacterium]
MNDSLRVVELLMAAKKISVDSSLELSQEALRLAQKTKLRLLEGLAYFQIGEFFYLLNRYEESYQAFMEAKNVFSRIDKLQYALSLFHAGRAKKAQSKYADALENYLTALNILENIGDEKTTSSLYLDIADIYRFTKDLVKAETFAQKALVLSSKNPPDKQGIVAAQITLGNILSEKGDYEKALNLYLLAVRLLEESKDKKGIGFVLHSIGMMHAHQQRYRVATEYFLKSIEYKKELNDVLGMAQSYAHMSESYFQMARFQEGIMAGKKAIELAEKVRAYEIVQNVSKT